MAPTRTRIVRRDEKRVNVGCAASFHCAPRPAPRAAGLEARNRAAKSLRMGTGPSCLRSRCVPGDNYI